jgi:hypothetical protein
MTSWRSGRSSLYETREWRAIQDLAAGVRTLSAGLDLGRDKEWLLYLLDESARLLTQALEEGWRSTYLADVTLGVYDALTYLDMLDYYLAFMRHQGYVPSEPALDLQKSIALIQSDLASLLPQLRAGGGDAPTFPSWSRN